MTKLTTTISRETGVWDRGKALMAVFHPRYLELRYKHGRKSWSIGYLEILWQAIRREAEEKREAKLAHKWKQDKQKRRRKG
jgi:hypothetical protein